MTPLLSGAFRWLWCSSVASAMANGMERTATAWLALTTGESNGAFVVGLVFAARMVPALLLGLTAGTLADRVNRARLLAVVGLCGLAIMVPFGWLVGTQTIQVWQVVVLAMLGGCLHAFDTPARQALTVDLVPRQFASNAVALNVLARSVGIGTGAFAVGLLIGSIGLGFAYPALGGAYAVAALLVMRVRTSPSLSYGAAERPSFKNALGDAARLILHNRAVRTLTLASVACEVFGFSYASAVPVIARDVLLAGPVELGILNAAAGFPGIVALLALATVQRRGRLEPILGGVFVTYGLGLLALSAARSLALAAAALVVIGACAATFDALQQTLIQLAVPEDQRGRAVGVWLFGIGSAPLGHLEMGSLSATLGAPSALMINGTIVLVAAATLLVRAPAYRLRPRASSP